MCLLVFVCVMHVHACVVQEKGLSIRVCVRLERTDRIVQCRAGYNRIWYDRALCVLEQQR